MFNLQELKNLYILLERTQLSGKESLTCAILMQKIEKLMNADSEPTGTPMPEKVEATGTNEPKE